MSKIINDDVYMLAEKAMDVAITERKFFFIQVTHDQLHKKFMIGFYFERLESVGLNGISTQ